MHLIQQKHLCYKLTRILKDSVYISGMFLTDLGFVEIFFPTYPCFRHLKPSPLAFLLDLGVM